MFRILKRFFTPPPSISYEYYEEARLVWSVLTALRGPDSDDPEEKQCTTSIIRRKLLGEDSSVEAYAKIGDDSEFQLKQRLLMDARAVASRHFLSHVRSAFVSLGLKWDKVNR